MRREHVEIEIPTQKRALIELLVPCIPIKLIEGSETGWPDTAFLIPGGRLFFIEFKWPGEYLEPKQVYQITLLLNLGYDVEAHDNVDEALAAIKHRAEKGRAEMAAAALHETRRKMAARERMRRFIPRSGSAKDFYNAGGVQLSKEARRR